MTKAEAIASFNPNGVGLRNGRFIGLPFDEENAETILFPVPWDVTVSYGAGTATGPQNILEASPQLDLLDPDIPDAWKMGLYMRPSPEYWLNQSAALRDKSIKYIDSLESGMQAPQDILLEINRKCEELRQWVYTETGRLLDAGKKVGLVGGEHSVPLGYLQALAEREGDFGVLQLDAHMDLRQAYEGFTYSHASIFYNAMQIPQITRLVQAGIRDYCQEEWDMAQSSQGRVRVFTDQDIRERQFGGQDFARICAEIIESLPQKVYISFDIDCLDPNLCPNTGTPVAGGFAFQEAFFLLKTLARSSRRIIGFDLCETGGVGNEWDGNVGARILYKLANWLTIS